LGSGLPSVLGYSPRVQAPGLLGRGGWIDTKRDHSLGSQIMIVLLDFWVFCCVNGLRVFDELRPSKSA
jgi:hypothetical protein